MVRRQYLLKWAKTTGGFIIEDDYDSEFRYSARPIPSLQGIDNDERIIYLGSFSKSITPSLRISYVILPKSFLDKYQYNKENYVQTASRITQKTLHLFMTNGHWEQHIRKMRRIYNKKNTILIKAIEEYLTKNVRLIGGNAGLHLLLEIRNGMDEDTVIWEAKKAGVKIYPTSQYWMRHNDLKHYPVVLLGFGGLGENQIVDGIKILANVLNDSTKLEV